MKNGQIFVLVLFVLITSLSVTAFAAQNISDRVEIDDDDIPAAIGADDLFGYQIEPIGDLDSDGVTDLAVIKFEDDSGETDAGSVLIMFMNRDATVKGTNEIIMDNSAAGILTCLAAGTTNRDVKSLEQLAFVGDLDGDGLPTLALGASSNDHGVADTGAVYMLELNTDGTVDNCVRIIPGENGFNPDNSVYNETTDLVSTNAALGWPLIATDLNGDGQNELIVGADSENDNFANLWVLFLTTGGAVSSHPAIPIKGETDIGTDTADFMDDGISIDGGTKIAVSAQKGATGEGSVFIINLTSAGAFVSSTEITGISLNVGMTASDAFGSGMAPLGDLDGDGVNDILVGNELGDDIVQDSGEAYILYMDNEDAVKNSQKISNETENARGAGTFLANTDLFGHGMAVWRTSGGTAYVAISATQDDTGGGEAGAIHIFSITEPSRGGNDEHKSRPTFGIDHNTFVQRVDHGLAINDQNFTVTDNYWTPMDLLELKVGETQKFTATVYASHTLYVMEFLFGIPEVGDWSNAEASVEIYTNFDGEALKYKINDNEISPIINATSLEYSSSRVPCVADDNLEPCHQVTIELSFNEAPTGKVLALQAIDYSRMNQILYFNDGLDITGDSLNPSVIKQIQSEIKYKGLQMVQRIDKANDIWMSMDKLEPVLLYKQNDVGSFFPIEYRTFETIPDKMNSNINRQHSEFPKLLEIEINRALEKFGYLTSYKQIQGDDLTDYDAEQTPYAHTSRADNVQLQQDMKDESIRAEELLVELLSKTHYATMINNNSHSGILDSFTSDDRTIGEILAEERVTKKIEAQERSYLKQVLGTHD